MTNAVIVRIRRILYYGKQQLWETSKLLCNQIVGEMKKGFEVLETQVFE